MCGEEFANKYVELLNIIINVITKQKVAESSSDFFSLFVCLLNLISCIDFLFLLHFVIFFS